MMATMKEMGCEDEDEEDVEDAADAATAVTTAPPMGVPADGPLPNTLGTAASVGKVAQTGDVDSGQDVAPPGTATTSTPPAPPQDQTMAKAVGDVEAGGRERLGEHTAQRTKRAVLLGMLTILVVVLVATVVGFVLAFIGRSSAARFRLLSERNDAMLPPLHPAPLVDWRRAVEPSSAELRASRANLASPEERAEPALGALPSRDAEEISRCYPWPCAADSERSFTRDKSGTLV